MNNFTELFRGSDGKSHETEWYVYFEMADMAK